MTAAVNKSVHELITSICPPIVRDLVTRSRVVRWKGPFPDWNVAKRRSEGYDSAAIARKTLHASLLVRDGKHPYERDGVVFASAQHEWFLPVCAMLLRIGIQNGNRIRVLDFGGALGGVFRAARPFLAVLDGITWDIVEQRRIVELGRAHFQRDGLRFFFSVEESVSATRPDVVLLSSVLQYLEDPYRLMADLTQRGIPDILLDRTLFAEGKGDQVMVQVTPRTIYRGSYPVWLLSWQRLRAFVEARGYSLRYEFENVQCRGGIPAGATSRGVLISCRAG